MLRNKLVKKVQDLDNELNQLFEELNSYSYEILNRKPATDIWSPIQVIDHLILSERLSLGYCKKKLSFDPKLKKANFRTILNGKLITWSLDSPFKFKAPGLVKTDQLIVEGSLDSMKIQWEKLRTEILEFINTVPEKYIDKEVYKHPFGLRMSLDGMLNFYKSHFRRHRRQIRRRVDS